MSEFHPYELPGRHEGYDFKGRPKRVLQREQLLTFLTARREITPEQRQKTYEELFRLAAAEINVELSTDHTQEYAAAAILTIDALPQEYQREGIPLEEYGPAQIINSKTPIWPKRAAIRRIGKNSGLIAFSDNIIVKKGIVGSVLFGWDVVVSDYLQLGVLKIISTESSIKHTALADLEDGEIIFSDYLLPVIHSAVAYLALASTDIINPPSYIFDPYGPKVENLPFEAPICIASTFPRIH